MNLRMFSVVGSILAMFEAEAMARLMSGTPASLSFPFDGHTFNLQVSALPAEDGSNLPVINAHDAGQIVARLGVLAAEAFFGEAGSTSFNVDIPGQSEAATVTLAVSRV